MNMKVRGIVMVAALVCTVGGGTSKLFAAKDPAAQCAASKRKAVGKAALDLMTCWSKAAQAKLPNPDQACIDKASAKMTAAFAKLDLKGGCLTLDDSEARLSALGYFASEQAHALPYVFENCTNGTDDDGNGFVDCQDYGCYNNPACNVCGNELLEGFEQCDGANLNGATCESLFPFLTGTLACDSSCAYDFTNCTFGSPSAAFLD